jgi:hypothetical protein
LAQGGFAVSVALLGLEPYLAWAYRDAFAPMLRMRTAPRTTERRSEKRKGLALATAR